MKYIDLYCSITAEDEMGGSPDETRHLCDSALRVWGGGGRGAGGESCSSLRSDTTENYRLRIMQS